MGLEKLKEAIRKFASFTVIDEKALKALIKDLQRVLLSSDVEVRLVFSLTKRVEERIRKEPRKTSLREHALKIVYEEISSLLSSKEYSPSLEKKRIMLIGLYGSGKTTTAGKIALFYKKKGLSTALISLDFDRPAGKEQLKQLSQKAGVKFYDAESLEKSLELVKSIKEDVVVIDTAGRSAFDSQLGEELRNIYNSIKPEEVFFVAPAEIGKVVKSHLEKFNEYVPINGVVITRFDGSGKAGGVLSSVSSLGIPITFVGTGEKLEDLELFSSKRFVAKLLGVPDLEGLLEKIRETSKEVKVEDEFTIETFYEQLKATKKMGIGSIFSGLGIGVDKKMLKKTEDEFKHYEAIINSMTKEERKNVDLVIKEKGRIERIARGCGLDELTVRRFFNQFFKMRKLFKRFKGERNLQRKFSSLLGKFGKLKGI